MAALYDPRYDFTPAHTAGDRSIALAERDPAYLQFKQTAMKKHSNLSPVAIANLFHRSKEQRNILPPLDVDALAENAIEAETAAPPAQTSDANPVFHMGIGSIAALEAKQSDERNAIGALDEYYSNMTDDQYAQEVAAQKYLTPTFTAAARIKEQQERERLALALSAPPKQPAADAPVLSAESSSYDHIPFAANAETQDFSQQTGPMGMSFNPPVPALTNPSTDTNTNNGTVVTGSTGPVLRQPTSNTASNGNAARRMTGGYTGNARDSDLPDMQIGLNERLMRMGAAGLAAGGQGSLAQMGAMFGASADVNQANRQAEMEAFGIEEERRQAHAARVAQLAASKNKGAGGGDMDKLKDFQAKNFGFYNRGVQAEEALLEVGDIGTDVFELLKSNVPLIGNNLVDPKFQRYDQARRNFVNAVLRRESGAVISDAEFENANIQYFPQPFDSAETIAQKQQNRRATMEGIRMGAGPSIFYTPTYPMAVPTDQGGGASDQETEDLVKKYTN